MGDITPATVPIAAPQILRGCLGGYRLITTASRLRPDSQILLWKLRIQEARLELWGKEWGLLEDDLSSTPESLPRVQKHSDTVIETLLRITDLLTDYQQLKESYGLSLVAASDADSVLMVSTDSEDDDEMDEQLISRQNSPSDPEDDEETDEKLISGQLSPSDIEELISQEFERYHTEGTDLQRQRVEAYDFLEKFCWVVSDRLKFETAVEYLKDCNDELYHLLSAAERRRLKEGLGASVVTSHDPFELSELQDASSDYGELWRIVSLKRTGIQIDSDFNRPSRRRFDESSILTGNLEIRSAEVTFLVPPEPISLARQQNRQLAMFKNRGGTPEKVLVEWRGQDISFFRIDGLARFLHNSMKPAGLCVPHCLGYLHDNWSPRTGFVFKVTGLGNSERVLSLHDVLASKTAPPWEDRFKLAFDLSMSLSILHLSGYLHKALRSHNIVFFSDENPTNSEIPNLTNPQLLGFEYTSLDRIAAGSSMQTSSDPEFNLYRHPQAPGPAWKRFKKSFDIYALGILLLEIAFWRRISEFWQDGYTAERFRHDLVTFHIPLLAETVSEGYMRVVELCVAGGFDEDGDVTAQKKLYWEVVRALSRLVV